MENKGNKAYDVVVIGARQRRAHRRHPGIAGRVFLPAVGKAQPAWGLRHQLQAGPL